MVEQRTLFVPAIAEACQDPGMAGTPLEMLTRCWYVWLEPYQYRELPVAWVVEACQVEKMTASRTLNYLVEQGYLQRGPNGLHGRRTYRFLVTRSRESAA